MCSAAAEMQPRFLQDCEVVQWTVWLCVGSSYHTNVCNRVHTGIQKYALYSGRQEIISYNWESLEDSIVYYLHLGICIMAVTLPAAEALSCGPLFAAMQWLW